MSISQRDVLLRHLSEPQGDQEGQHSMAEDLLVIYLNSIGDGELADAWEKAQTTQGWWYA